MRYAITWSTPAFEAMDQLVRDNPARRGEFAAALRSLSDALGSNPLDEGESREGDRRIGFFGPLVVTYRVIRTADRVVVTAVRDSKAL